MSIILMAGLLVFPSKFCKSAGLLWWSMQMTCNRTVQCSNSIVDTIIKVVDLGLFTLSLTIFANSGFDSIKFQHPLPKFRNHLLAYNQV